MLSSVQVTCLNCFRTESLAFAFAIADFKGVKEAFSVYILSETMMEMDAGAAANAFLYIRAAMTMAGQACYRTKQTQESTPFMLKHIVLGIR